MYISLVLFSSLSLCAYSDNMGKLRKACANCIKYKLACETKRPCSRCVLHQCSCIDVERKPRAARRPKRPRTSLELVEGVDSCAPVLPATTATALCAAAASPPRKLSLNSQANAPFVPELVLNDNEPLFSSNLDTNPFMMQSTEASLLPFSDASLFINGGNGYLSSILGFDQDPTLMGAPLMPKVEPGLGAFDDFAKKTDFAAKSAPSGFNLSPQSFVQSNPPATVGAANKFVVPAPQPLVLVNKSEWQVIDCNVEFAQFLGYTTVAEFTASLDTMNTIISPESIGLSKQNFEYFLTAKVNHFERLGMLKSKDGTERTVTLHVDILDKLMMFTIKEVYDMRPMCFYTRWLKAVAPNAVTPCDRVGCQCRLYDYLPGLQQQQQQAKQFQSLASIPPTLSL